MWKLARHLWTFCNDDTNARGLRLLEFVTFNDLVLANTFGHHKASRGWTWHSSNRQFNSQIDCILVRKRFRSEVNIARTRSFSGVDIGSDHDLQMMTFRLRLKKISKPKHTRLKFDLQKLKDPNVLETFQAVIGGRSEDHEGIVSIGGRTNTNLRFADDIDGLAGEEEELANFVEGLDTKPPQPTACLLYTSDAADD